VTGQRGRLLVGGVLAVALMAFFFRGVDTASLGAAFRAADPVDLGLLVFSTILTYMARAWRWGYLLAPLARVPFLRLLSATYVGFTAGMFVPRAGEVVRPWLVGRRHAIPTSAAFASIILERLVDLVTVLAMFGGALVFGHIGSHLDETTRRAVQLAGLLAALGALVALGVLLALHVKAQASLAVLAWFLKPLPARWAGAVSAAAASFAEGLGVLRASASHLLAIAAQSALVWLLIAAGVHFCNRAFGIDLPFHASFVVLGFLVVGVAIPTPGNVGGFHETYLLALTKVFGVDRDVAAAAGLTCHALTNLPVLLIGLALLPTEGLSLGKVSEISETQP
jgi:uncharacterized protein (TIRG00374 family)